MQIPFKNQIYGKKKRMRSNKLHKWPDRIEWILCTLVSGALIFCLYRLSMLDLKIMIAIAGILIALDLIFLVLLLKRKQFKWTSVVFRIVLLVYVLAAGYGTYTLNNTYNALNDITSSVQSIVKIDLLTKSDSSLNSIEDFANKKDRLLQQRGLLCGKQCDVGDQYADRDGRIRGYERLSAAV